MSLVNELIKGLLPEQEKKKVVAVYGGGFKPPTSGHFKVVKQALEENPEIDKFIIFIGGKERNGISPDESILIWDIYKQYLPFKVEVKYTSVPPIKSVYNYAKDHPDEEVLWVIGAREGNEDDFSDIAKRTKSLDNYPNLELEVMVTASGASGTAARNASKISLEKLKPMLPKILSDDQYKEIFNILDPNLKENEPPLLKEILDPANFDFKPLIKSLTSSMEKDGLILKPYPKIIFKHDEEANAEDFFGKTAYYDPNNNEVVLYTLGRHPKDIMRSYAHELIHVHQNHEDRLEGINTDDVNEDDYLEKIEREAYEKGNISFRSWTNKILNEAIVGEKIECDNCDWSWDIVSGGDDLFVCHKCGHDNEPISEKKNKDPFGLNAFAHDLAQLNEEDGEYYIYLDMDGVVADFDKRFEELSGMLPQSYVDKNGLKAFWDLIDEKHKVAFWRGIELMPGAEQLVRYVEQHPFEMLTAPSIKKQSVIGKSLWVKDKVGTLYSMKPKVTYRSAKQKHTVKPNLSKFDILIDDKGSTIDNWNAAGGTAILYQNAGQVINDLKKLGL